jgi:hypothetical protein
MATSDRRQSMRKPFILLFLAISSCAFQRQGRDGNNERADSTLKAINRNLELVNQKQGIISVASNQFESLNSIADNRRIQNRIEGNIVLIDSVMSDHRARLLALERLLGINRRRVNELELQIASLEQALDAKQREIDSLKRALNRSGAVASSLHDSLRTAYVLMAPQDSLEHWKVIVKKGGVLGIGSTWRLSGHVPLKKFTRVNLLKTGRVVVPAKAEKFKVMTVHDPKSYTVTDTKGKSGGKGSKKNSSVITISDPGQFWTTSRILVIKLPNKSP